MIHLLIILKTDEKNEKPISCIFLVRIYKKKKTKNAYALHYIIKKIYRIRNTL